MASTTQFMGKFLTFMIKLPLCLYSCNQTKKAVRPMVAATAKTKVPGTLLV